VPSSDPRPKPFTKQLFNQLVKAAKRMASRRNPVSLPVDSLVSATGFSSGHHRAMFAEVISCAMAGETDERPYRRAVSAPLVTSFPTSDELGALHRRLRELSDPIILDFCAGSRPFARVLLPELSNLRVVSVDCEHLPPLDLTAAEHARHLEIVADLTTLTMQDIEQRVWERFRLPLANVVFQGAFPTCTHISTASVVGGAHPHRNPDYSPSTPAAVASDALLLKSLALVAEIHRTYGAPGVVEQPASEVLFQVPSFRSWLEANPQVTVNYYDQCAVSLPGEVTPKKPTVIFGFGVRPFDLSCNGSCSCRLSGTGLHRRVIAPRRPRPGQQRVDSASAGVLPCGAVLFLLSVACARDESLPSSGAAYTAAISGFPCHTEFVYDARTLHAASGHSSRKVLGRTLADTVPFRFRLKSGAVVMSNTVPAADLAVGEPCDTCVLAKATHSASRHTNRAKSAKKMSAVERRKFQHKVHVKPGDRHLFAMGVESH
jgi:hypothetical protein